MLFLIPGRHDPRRPEWPYRMRADSPQAQGLEVWMPFAPKPLVFSRSGVLGPATTLDPTDPVQFIGHPVGGLGAQFTGVGSGYYDQAYSDTPFLTSAGITIVYIGVVDVVDAFRAFMVKGNAFSFYTGFSGTGLDLIRGNGGGTNWQRASIIPTAGKFSTFAVRVTDNLIETLADMFIDGVKATASTVGGFASGAVTGSSANITFAREILGGNAMIGSAYDVRFYNQALSDGVIQSMCDPATRWDLYDTQRVMFLDLGGGGGGAGKGRGGGKKGGGGGLNILYPGGAYEYNIGNPGLDIGST